MNLIKYERYGVPDGRASLLKSELVLYPVSLAVLNLNDMRDDLVVEPYMS